MHMTKQVGISLPQRNFRIRVASLLGNHGSRKRLHLHLHIERITWQGRRRGAKDSRESLDDGPSDDIERPSDNRVQI